MLALTGVALWAMASRRRATGLALMGAGTASLLLVARLAGWS